MFDLVSNYCFSLDKDTKKSVRYFLLLSSLEKYVNGAIIEMRRLRRVRKALRNKVKSGKMGRDNHLTYLVNDTHFYFVCIDKAYKLLSRLGTELDDPDIKKLARQLGKNFDIKTVRNHLEHIDARCLGFLTQKDEDNKISRDIGDFGNFINENFSFNDKKFPSGKASLTELKDIYKELIKILRSKYASKDPRFIHREQSEKRYKAIMKVLKKADLFNCK